MEDWVSLLYCLAYILVADPDPSRYIYLLSWFLNHVFYRSLQWFSVFWYLLISSRVCKKCDILLLNFFSSRTCNIWLSCCFFFFLIFKYSTNTRQKISRINFQARNNYLHIKLKYFHRLLHNKSIFMLQFLDISFQSISILDNDNFREILSS